MDKVPIGISYDEFLQTLLRVTIKKQQIFNQVYKKFYKSGINVEDVDVGAFVDQKK